MTLHLKAKKREAGGNLSAMRKAGSVPAVLYGAKVESTPIAVSATEFKKIWKQAGESTIVSLDVEGEGFDVLIQDVERDPVTDAPVHIDFYAVDKDKKVSVHVPLVFEGEAPAVKNLGGTLVKVLHEIEVEGLPKDLPHDIAVDVSLLSDLDSHIAVKDISLPSGITAVTDAEEIIVSVAAPRDEEEETAEEADISSIEVEKKGKKDEEESDGE